MCVCGGEVEKICVTPVCVRVVLSVRYEYSVPIGMDEYSLFDTASKIQTTPRCIGICVRECTAAWAQSIAV